MQPAPGTDLLTMHGAGGTAIVSASSSAPSIHVSVVFNGIFSPEEFADVPVVVRLESLDKQQVVLQEVNIISSQPYVDNMCIINVKRNIIFVIFI
jgi:chordin